MFDLDGKLLWERPMDPDARTLHIRRVRWEAAGDCVAAWFETPGKSVYWTTKNKKKQSGRVEYKKYCAWCNKHTQHKETK